MKQFLLNACLLAGFVGLPAQAGEASLREQWKQETIAYLQTISPTNTTRTASVRSRPEANYFRYTLQGEGMIQFGTKGWVYVKMHSKDHDPRGREGIGDIVLAIDQDGKLYQNNGHVCGGIQLKSKSGKAFEHIREFLQVKIFKEPWKPLSPTGEPADKTK